jgi:hypothetical protein
MAKGLEKPTTIGLEPEKYVIVFWFEFYLVYSIHIE